MKKRMVPFLLCLCLALGLLPGTARATKETVSSRINSVEIDVPAPKVGAKPVLFPETKNEKYTLAAAWYDLTEGERLVDTDSETFQPGHTYEYRALLFANDGYTFYDVSEGTGMAFGKPYTYATVAGQAAQAYIFESGGRKDAGTFIHCTFPTLPKRGADGSTAARPSAGSDTVVRRIDITLKNPPAVGETCDRPDYEPPAGLERDGWRMEDSYGEMFNHKTCQPGEVYTLLLYLKLLEGYSFVDGDPRKVTAAINGIEAETSATTSGPDGIRLECTFPALPGEAAVIEDTVIRRIDITDAYVPKAGDTIDFMPYTIATEGVKGYTYGWKDDAGGTPITLMHNDKRFEAGRTYTWSLGVKTEPHYIFATTGSGKPDVAVTVNGESAAVGGITPLSNQRYVLDFTYTFPTLTDQPEAKPETKPEAKPETQTETKPETQSETQPQAKPETQPETKPEPQPAEKKNPFTDVKESDYFYDAVLWAYYADPQVTNGITATTFGPSSSVTRGQAVTFLWRAMGCPEPKTKLNPFTDVKENEYYYKPILWAVEQGITNGTGNGQFSPNQTCSTAHILTFLYRTLGIGDNGWYQEAAAWAKGAGLLKGLTVQVEPGVECPRSDVVLFLYRCPEKS